jgi:eukaryotic-like serine/threonine-protein kinase
MGRSAHGALIGRTIAGKFLIEAPLGAGAMGAVFRARQVALEKTVAIKVLHGEHAGDASFVARFQREAKAASRLNHPNSMQVIDFGAEPDGLLYIAMEYLDGRNLHRVLKEEGPLDAPRIVDIVMQTLAALAVAHDMGVVHRDLKPDNIMILSGTDDDGRPKDIVKVCDFGIAKISDSRAYRNGPQRTSDAPLTTAGLMIGTPEYMSPEQGSGMKLDARSDLYSVGVILFEMLTGRVPFETENALGTILKHLNEVPPRPSEIAPHVDLRLEAVCLRALRKDREQRFAGAREMRAELRAALDGPAGREPDAQAVRAENVSTGEPASISAPTVKVPLPEVAEAPKATLAGTTSSVPRPHSPGRALALAASTVAAVAAGVLFLLVRSHTQAASPAPAMGMAANVAGSPSAASTAPPTDLAPLAPLDTAATAHIQSSAAGGRTRALGKSSATAPAVKIAIAGNAPPGNAGAGNTAAAPILVAPVNAPLPALLPAASAAAPQAPPPATSPVPTPAAPEGPDPLFDPDHGYVEVGLINGMGVRDNAVRGLLHGVALSNCYKTALRSKGSRATGVATLNLTFDENGVVRSALMTDAGFLPGMVRCIQTSAMGQRVPTSQVDSAGGTAEAWLTFKVR